ncbi:MAG: helix-turn-helix transcriptional regulator [Candidatus Riflebacteria bacterium]|nr:helix-turn-helix transcriptional regulator [Candidatus Riflebacteria bacterium]
MTVQERWKRLMASTMASDDFKNTQIQTEIIVRFLQKMREKNISQTELAKRTGLKKSYISRALSSSSNLTLATIRKIAESLEVDVCFSLRDKIPEEQSIALLSELVTRKPEPILARIFILPETQSWDLTGDQNEGLPRSA